MRGFGGKTSKLESQLKRKRRRNSSGSKSTANNIFFSIDQNKKIAAQLDAAKDKDVVFSDRVLRLNAKMKLVPFQLIITSQNYYLFKDKSGKFKESNSLKNIESICLSHQSDNFMLIKIKGRKPDVLLVSRRKTQISEILAEQVTSETSPFAFTITDKFKFIHINELKYNVIFTGNRKGYVEVGIYEDESNPPEAVQAALAASAKKKK